MAATWLDGWILDSIDERASGMPAVRSPDPSGIPKVCAVGMAGQLGLPSRVASVTQTCGSV